MIGVLFMPEIPEMETYKKHLQQLITGKVITSVQVNREKSINFPPFEFRRQLEGHSVAGVSRYGKALFFLLDSGQLLFLHLMLGGKLFWGTKEQAPDRSKQVILTFEDSSLFFIGLRLGHLNLITADEQQNYIAGLGPDALSGGMTADTFIKQLKGKRSAVKTVLTDQKFMAGIGNRYSDEICFAAKCNPRKRANEIHDKMGKVLFASIRSVLNEAIRFGGYMDLPLYKGDRLTGGYSNKMNVHGRENEACPRCGRVIEMVKIASKKTYFCPQCQQSRPNHL